MSKHDFYVAVPDRVSFLMVHWARGCRLIIPYACIMHVGKTRANRFSIHTAIILIQGVYAPPGTRSRAERDVVKAAKIPAYDQPASKASSKARPVGQANLASSPKEAILSAQTDNAQDPQQNLDTFMDDLAQARVFRLHHVPDAGMLLRVLRMTGDGPQPYTEE